MLLNKGRVSSIWECRGRVHVRRVVVNHLSGKSDGRINLLRWWLSTPGLHVHSKISLISHRQLHVLAKCKAGREQRSLESMILHVGFGNTIGHEHQCPGEQDMAGPESRYHNQLCHSGIPTSTCPG